MADGPNERELKREAASFAAESGSDGSVAREEGAPPKIGAEPPLPGGAAAPGWDARGTATEAVRPDAASGGPSETGAPAEGGTRAFRSGFVAIIGRPNVGKSTLLNAFLGAKVAIVSPKPQTTRNRIRGVLTEDRGQIIFIDTPGIHRPRTELGRRMVDYAYGTLREVDAVLVVMDASAGIRPEDREIVARLPRERERVYLLINKVDLVRKATLLPLLEEARTLYPFREFIPVSAVTGENLRSVLDVLFRDLPEGPAFYPPDVRSDHPETFVAQEIIREKILHLTEEEVPHSVAVVVEGWEEKPAIIVVRATIVVERASQKGILIGKGGRMLKEIGRLAREELEAIFGTRFYLELWVKVREDWRNRPGLLHHLGYRREP
ncbi:GTPase Era [Hydrogenibacillus schlegelii]|uniref:GTPase Era n=1 Tax=Hydrogenibacillus schlegelii TaxID=1484 RepID=UPI0009E7F03F|nr:GTPase Era [Hydrogenibacillus schlegelii]